MKSNNLLLSILQSYNPALRLKPDAMTATGSGSGPAGSGDLTLASGVRQSLSAVSDSAEDIDGDGGNTGSNAKG